MVTMKRDAKKPDIEGAIRAAGGRATPARALILEMLRSAAYPMSHSEVEVMLSRERQAVDRVTIYRVLDWLAEAGLAHKAADGHGVFRFSSADPGGEHARHAHLRCTGCGGTFCLDMPSPQQPRLPRGFRFGGMALDIHGECPRCAHTHS